MTCPTGKTRFPGEGAAKKALRARQEYTSQRLRIYCCPLCKGGWHFTSRA